MTSHSIFLALHSIFRYLVLITALIVVIQSLVGMMGKKTFKPANRKAALFMLISCDLQLLIGFIVYYLGGTFSSFKVPGMMSDRYSRFYAVEHPVAMILGIVFVHIAYTVAKKNMDDEPKFRRMFWYSFIALFLFMAMIPWPGKKDIGKPMFPSVSMNQ